MGTTPSLMYIGTFGSFGVLFALMAFKNQHPLNAQLLFVWTLMEAYTVGVVCASYTAAGQGRIVVEALVLTWAIFASLTLYTVYSKRDWSFMEAGLRALQPVWSPPLQWIYHLRHVADHGAARLR